MNPLTAMLEEEDLQELMDTATRMALPPSVYARSLVLRAPRSEIAEMDGHDGGRE